MLHGMVGSGVVGEGWWERGGGRGVVGEEGSSFQ